MSLRWVPISLAMLGLLVLGTWLFSRPTPQGTALRLPGADAEQATAMVATELTGKLTVGSGKAGDSSGAWPWFRGQKLDNISSDGVALSREWGSSGPKKLWELELAEGYAGAAVRDGRVYLLDYDTQNRADVMRCLSLEDGNEIWRRAYGVDVGRNHGITRTVPAVTQEYVVSIGPKCHVVCLDAHSGEFKWGIDLVRDYQTEVPPWYAGQCPLIDGDKVILAPGGSALLMAVDLASGKVIWQTPNPRRWQMTHSSVVPMIFAGKRTYVYCGSGGVVGVSADDGRILWETTEWKVTMATVPTPVIVGEDRVFLTGGYGAGSMMLQLHEAGGKIEPTVLFRLKPEVFGSDQHTPILHDGKIYGVIPGGQLACLDLEGKRLWASGSKARFGLGPYMMADGKFILMNDTGTLTLAEATAEGYRQLAQAKIFQNGHDAWGPFALVNGRLLARDMTRLVCLDLRAETKP